MLYNYSKTEIKETVLVVLKTVCAYIYIPLVVSGGRVREGVPKARRVRSPRTICVYVERMDIKRHTSILRDRRRGRIGARREREKDKRDSEGGKNKQNDGGGDSGGGMVGRRVAERL